MARLVTVLQVAGSLLAIPVGLTSAYSLYRANFSPESTCQTLRANILATLDKGVDATTRRALVRRDAEAFERSCGTVDPDASAAFKSLMAAHPAPPHPAGPANPPPTKAASSPAPATRQQAVHDRPITANPDAVWVAAVRRALLTQPREQPSHLDSSIAAPSLATQRMPLDVRSTRAEPQAIPAPAATVPALPPATAVAAIPAPATDAEHPVPPEAIPVPAPNDADAGVPGEQQRSRIGNWISHVPLLKSVIGDGRR